MLKVASLIPSGMAKAVADVNGDNTGGFASDGSNVTGFSQMHDSGTGGVSMLLIRRQYQHNECLRGTEYFYSQGHWGILPFSLMQAVKATISTGVRIQRKRELFLRSMDLSKQVLVILALPLQVRSMLT